MRTRFFTSTRLTAGILAAAIAAPLGTAMPALAQSSPGYFMPPSGSTSSTQKAAPSRTRGSKSTRREPVAAAPLPPEPEPEADQGQQQPLPPLPQPPVPTLPALAKEAPPPPVVIGVLGVPDVMRASSAAQIIQRVIGARKEKLRADVERDQAAWRELESSLQADAPKLTPEQGRAREQALRTRVNNDRRQLQERNRVISEAGQVGLNQIESTLVAVIRQVAEAHGMNVVLHRSQVALNQPQFDITDEVVTQLNKLMPTVKIPEDGVDPATLPKDWADPPPSAAPAPAASQPASPAQ
jgi:Skp family chaperone for outer membrane proteins